MIFSGVSDQYKQNRWCQRITDEQKLIYDEILNIVDRDLGAMFFDSKFGGSWKTFVWIFFVSAIRSRKIDGIADSQ